jgi:uncharacterized protein (TIGR03435 family)
LEQRRGATQRHPPDRVSSRDSQSHDCADDERQDQKDTVLALKRSRVKGTEGIFGWSCCGAAGYLQCSSVQFQCNAIDLAIRENHNVTVAHITFAAAALFLCAQTTTELPSFELAEIKVNKAVNADGSFRMLPSGQVAIRHASMKELIQGAWNLEDYAISGGPNWIDNEYYDVVAKAPPNSSMHDMELMLQRLLAERFRLAIHTEPKVMAVYAMVAAKGGLKMKEAPAGTVEGGCRNTRTTGVLRRECKNTPLRGLAIMLPSWASGYIKIPVIDKTGLKGGYDFTLAWTGRGVLNGGNANGEKVNDDDGSGGNGLTVFEALEKQLGLKLESRKEAVTITVIDRVERVPTDN